MAEKVCKICGKVFDSSVHNKVYCSAECAKVADERRNRQWWINHQTKTDGKKGGVCDSYCKGCTYSSLTSGEQLMCAYYLITNIRRPCPAGKGCTVKATGRKKGLWAYENNQTWSGRQKREGKPAQDKPAEVLHKVCHCCGTEFETEYPNRVYCSNKCKNKVAQKAFHHRKKTELTITCVICGKQFTSTDARRKCCSSECTKENRKLHDMNRGKRHEETESVAGTV